MVGDGREYEQDVVFELRQILEDVPLCGMEEVDDPDVAPGIDEDVRGVEVTVYVRHVVELVVGQRGIRQELVVEPARVADGEPAREVEYLGCRVIAECSNILADR